MLVCDHCLITKNPKKVCCPVCFFFNYYHLFLLMQGSGCHLYERNVKYMYVRLPKKSKSTLTLLNNYQEKKAPSKWRKHGGLDVTRVTPGIKKISRTMWQLHGHYTHPSSLPGPCPHHHHYSHIHAPHLSN